ncbi:uncharacterized protein LOC121387886 [Gigantopelta aegis]|uniref:uncharacterized protein LOC121387886 n=1 Tax=Gigantopelta aegis TaxID=1735272 RepID=UPI001B887929|nr:uncharacterized protein LOC121387886 [Gigantopelta aegis]
MNMDQPSYQLQTMNMIKRRHTWDQLPTMNMDQPSHQLPTMNMSQPSHQLPTMNMIKRIQTRNQLQTMSMDQPGHQLQTMSMAQPSHQLPTMNTIKRSHTRDQLQTMSMDQPSHQCQTMNMDQPSHQLQTMSMDLPSYQLQTMNMDQQTSPSNQLQTMNSIQQTRPHDKRHESKMSLDVQKTFERKTEEPSQGSAKDVSDMKIRMSGDKYVSFRKQAVKDCDEYYPDCDKKTYRVPPMTTESKRVIEKPNDEYSVIKERNEENDKGQHMTLEVCHSLEDLKCIHGKDQPMFIITNYEFENYLKGLKTKLFPGTDILPLESGEHDILLLHLQHGAVFIQVKAVEECKPEATKQQRDNRNKMIRRRVEEGLKQLDSDVKMFRHIMKDLGLNIPVTKVLALPNINKTYISKLTTTVQLLKCHLGERALDVCLFRKHININRANTAENQSKREKLLEWWKCNISCKPGFRNGNEYRQVIGRYVGLMSTVQLRTFGDAVAEEGYQNMRIILTPEQVEILHSNDKKVYIQGRFGTGKTILLILKARQLVKEGQPVLMVCGRSTKVLTYLVACVKADLTEEQKQLVHYITDYKTIHSLNSLEQYNMFVDECNISTVCYVMDYCCKNTKLCWLAGRYVPHIKELTVKNLSKVLRLSDKVKTVCDELDEDMLCDFVKSNAFPIINHSCHEEAEAIRTNGNECLFDRSTIWRCMQCWEQIVDIFVQLGLMKRNPIKSSLQTVPTTGTGPTGEVKKKRFNQCNTWTKELHIITGPQNPLAWSDVVILLPHGSFITIKDIEAIDQISLKYGIPLNYFLLRGCATAENISDSNRWTETDDEDILLGKRNEIVICHVSQFLGLERKIVIAVELENVTCNREMSDWTSMIDVKNILTPCHLPSVLSNLEDYHLLSDMLEPRSVLSQLLLLLADTYTGDSDAKNNTLCTIKVRMSCFFKLMTIIADMGFFSKYKNKVKAILETCFPSQIPNTIISLLTVLTKESVFSSEPDLLKNLERCAYKKLQVDSRHFPSTIKGFIVVFNIVAAFVYSGLLKVICTNFVKMESFHSAISRSTSQVFVWSLEM